jgi:hypothetical protein
MAISGFVYLRGPNLVNSANEIIQGLNGGKISRLYISGIVGKDVSEIHRALTLLRGHFNQNAIIYLSEFPSISSEKIKMIASASGVKVQPSGNGAFLGLGFGGANRATLMQMQTSDMQQAQNIFTQIGAEAQKSQVQRWKINSDLQMQIHEITAKVTVNKAKMADKAMNAIYAYIAS